MRGSGEYPIAGVAVSLDSTTATSSPQRGSRRRVEDVARRAGRCRGGARRASGCIPAAGEEAGRAAAAASCARARALDAPGWYRLAVLPALVRARRRAARRRDGLSAHRQRATPRRWRSPGFAPLVQVLRDDLGLTGTKVGCFEGFCGACIVIVDGADGRSCLYPVALADGAEVRTVEGLAGADAA